MKGLRDIVCLRKERSLSTKNILSFLGLYSMVSCSAPNEIERYKAHAIYFDRTVVSVSGQNISYYSPDGVYKTFDIQSKETTFGSWFAKDAHEICISFTSDGTERSHCWRVKESGNVVTLTAYGLTAYRPLSEFYPGDQIEKLSNELGGL